MKLEKYVLLNEYYWWNYTFTIPLTCLHSMFCFCVPRSQHGTSWRDPGRTSIPGVLRQCDGRQLRWRAWPGQHMKTSRLTIHLIHIHVKNETLLDDSPFLRIQLHCMLSYWYFTLPLCYVWPYLFWCFEIMIMTTCFRDFWH